MPPKTVLACLTDLDGAPSLCAAGVALAQPWEAHFVGLHVMEGLVVYPSFRVELPTSVYRSIADQQQRHGTDLEAAFDRATADLGARAEWRLLSAQGGSSAALVVDSARAADVVLMSAAEEGADTQERRFVQEAVIRGCGRPVLVVPRGFAFRGLERAVVGWRDTPEATRALHDLVPLLAPGAALRLVAFGDGSDPDEPGHVMRDLAASLARHDLRVEIERRPRDGRPVATRLEEEARAFEADVLAVGAYGHSRAYDLIIGAVSRELLRRSGLPVLFSR